MISYTLRVENFEPSVLQPFYEGCWKTCGAFLLWSSGEGPGGVVLHAPNFVGTVYDIMNVPPRK